LELVNCISTCPALSISQAMPMAPVG